MMSSFLLDRGSRVDYYITYCLCVHVYRIHVRIFTRVILALLALVRFASVTGCGNSLLWTFSFFKLGLI